MNVYMNKSSMALVVVTGAQKSLRNDELSYSASAVTRYIWEGRAEKMTRDGDSTAGLYCDWTGAKGGTKDGSVGVGRWTDR